jgi:hypothetical protein
MTSSSRSVVTAVPVADLPCNGHRLLSSATGYMQIEDDTQLESSLHVKGRVDSSSRGRRNIQ